MCHLWSGKRQEGDARFLHRPLIRTRRREIHEPDPALASLRLVCRMDAMSTAIIHLEEQSRTFQETAMFDLIKKTLLTGVGLAVMTKDKVEELGKEFASQAKLSELEGKEFVDHLLKQSEMARKDFETRISSAVQKAVSGLNLASKDEVAKLSAKVEELTAKLSCNSKGTSG